MAIGVQAEASPSGLVDTTTWLCPSTAAQNEVEGQETATSWFPSATLCAVTVQVAPGPSLGSVEVRTSPTPSTATQNVFEGHETPKIDVFPSTPLCVQDAGS